VTQPKTGSELREKHRSLKQSQGAIGSVAYCEGCKSPSGVLTSRWPCEVIEALEDGERYRKFFDDVETTYGSDISDREVIDQICDLIVEVTQPEH